jgi:hypothetical protein
MKEGGLEGLSVDGRILLKDNFTEVGCAGVN